MSVNVGGDVSMGGGVIWVWVVYVWVKVQVRVEV